MSKANSKAIIRQALNDHISIMQPPCFVRRRDKVLVSEKSFNRRYNSFVNEIEGLKTRYLDNAAKFAIASPALETAESFAYRPGAPDMIEDPERDADGKPYTVLKFNTWRDPKIQEIEDKPAMFLDHIRYLIQNDFERQMFMCWLAWKFQRQQVKLDYGVLMIGPGGTGKSLIGKYFEVMLGKENVAMIDRDDALTSTFNGFSENKSLAFVHEMAPDPKIDLLGKVKGLITEDHIIINRKGIERYEAENHCDLIGVTNEPGLIKMLRSNRRWLVVQCADDVRYVDERGQPTSETAEYYAKLFAGCGTPAEPGEEARRLHWYLRTQVDLAKYKFDGKGLAPLTVAKEEVVQEGIDSLGGRVADRYASYVSPFDHDLLTAAEIAIAMHVENNPKLTDAMHEAGCRKIRRPDGTDAQVRLEVRGEKERCRLWAINPAKAAEYAKLEPSELRRLYYSERDGALAPAAADFEDLDRGAQQR